YFRIQLVYTAGRNEAMKSFIETSHLLEVVKEIDQKRADDEKEQRREIIRLCKYMEALVAYFKYYGGKD
ncbi:type III-A CRISPR-associated protein Csm2, partial [Lactobacillus delbrueckii subsp. bulgaricus]|nr:type III-A CRISPR-associated protein Csm2 [Lactobacillus delbrueckii subsp. bulgaricus]